MADDDARFEAEAAFASATVTAAVLRALMGVLADRDPNILPALAEAVEWARAETEASRTPGIAETEFARMSDTFFERYVAQIEMIRRETAARRPQTRAWLGRWWRGRR